GLVKTSLGSPKKVAELPPRSPSSGFLDELHSKGTMGKPSPLLQPPSCRSRCPDQAPMGSDLRVLRWGFLTVFLLGSEKLASTSLDARISVGVHVWTLTPDKRPGLDAKTHYLLRCTGVVGDTPLEETVESNFERGE
ncbi:hypothetical protein Taro_032705, partial [Colocasia esculenta]|nr:hypothetical protein [Colocasia esculenta]